LHGHPYQQPHGRPSADFFLPYESIIKNFFSGNAMMKPKDLVGPKPPASLSKAAKAEWRELAPIAWNSGSLKAERFRAFSLMCEALAEEKAARAIVAREGIVIGQAQKTHPAIKIANEARRVALSLLIDFQLSARPGHLYSAALGGEEVLERLNDAAVEHHFRPKRRKRRRRKPVVSEKPCDG
jgi:hypothetical protein